MESTGLDETLAELGIHDEESFDKFVESGVYGDEIEMEWPEDKKPIATSASKKKKKGKKKAGVR